MTATRYFEVKVTGCKNCLYTGLKQSSWWNAAFQYCIKGRTQEGGRRLMEENFRTIAPSCPMWNETKEAVTIGVTKHE